MYYRSTASIDCNDCHVWQYNVLTGEIETRGRSGIKVRREGPPPCSKCPKESPENGKTLQLHPRNARLLEFYKMSQAKGSIPKPFDNDPMTLELFSLIDDLKTEIDGKKELDKQLRLERSLQLVTRK